MNAAKRAALCGLLIALALVLSYAERMLPSPVPSVPGIKLGLANAVTLVILYARFPKPALTAVMVTILRVLLGGLLFSGLWSMLYSLAGAVLSLIAMLTLKRLPFSIIGVSVAGGVTHNIAQLAIASLALNEARLMWYFPVLILAGIASGAVISLIAALVSKRLKG
jgi:heptaprenyl diphosphate synthase